MTLNQSLLKLLACVAAFAALGTPAMAEVSGPYVSGGMIGVLPNDPDFQGAAAGQLDLGVGLGTSAALGYQMESGIRVEGEISWRRAGADNFAGAATGGSVSAIGLLANLVYEFDNDSGIYPYLGLGGGLARLNANDLTIAGVNVDDSDLAFAWQGLGGVAFALDPNLSLVAEYRYFGTMSPDFTNAAGGNLVGEFSTHTALLGLRYRFGDAPARSVASTAAAASTTLPVVTRDTEQPRRLAPPAPAMATETRPEPALPVAQARAAMALRRTYVVFFDTDSAALDTEAQRVVGEASQQAIAESTRTIDVTGHADRAGSAAYNMQLSQRRAESAAKQLRANSVPAELRLFARGEDEPLVPTEDGQAEPRNRRVEIVLQGQGDGLPRN
ncbi:MAG: outer membrane beta-barrel protein [Pseudomonadota bacterium]|nr:outer membrane beta-barrel protein [Pseudomonadota bacterium]